MRGKRTSICFDEKPFMNIVFYVLLCLIALEKKNVIIFDQQQILLKMRSVTFIIFSEYILS